MCDAVVELMSDDGQCIIASCEVQDPVALVHQEVVLRIAHEFLSNAVKHGMHVRLVGRIIVRVFRTATETVLTVGDDGWGCGAGTAAW